MASKTSGAEFLEKLTVVNIFAIFVRIFSHQQTSRKSKLQQKLRYRQSTELHVSIILYIITAFAMNVNYKRFLLPEATRLLE